MSNYLHINQVAYDRLADEYNSKSTKNIEYQKEILDPFIRRLKESHNGTIRVLDVGCGVGVDSLILSTHGLETYGVDISNKMIDHAKKNAPFTQFLNGNFLESDGRKYHGILMDAFFHLFPYEDIDYVIKKTISSLEPNGIVLISTTLSEKSKEGYYTKNDYTGKIKRFRRFWTKEDLIKVFEINGFKLLNFYIDYQRNAKKEWMNAIFQLV